MSAIFSAIDIETRMQVHDLLSRFCHSLDHNKPGEWAALFSDSATVEAPRFGMFAGKTELMTIPALVASEGGGTWRHLFNNVLIQRRPGLRDYGVRAYCIVNDFGKGGAAIRCWDFAAGLQRKRTWLITSLKMQPVGQFCSSPRSYNSRPVAVPPPCDVLAPAEWERGAH